jgi:hypothetical protein
MKHLFFVSVVFGILSGTPVNSQAQRGVDLLKPVDDLSEKIPPHFIEGFEIRPGFATSGSSRTNFSAYRNNKPFKIGTYNSETSIEACKPIQFKYAQLMDVEVESITNLDLYNSIEQWYGTHYLYGGSSHKGVDCSAYTGALLSEVWGASSPRSAREQYGAAEKISLAEIQEGDLVFFNTLGGVSHVGMYLQNGYFTHASSSRGVTINNLNENYYRTRLIGAGRIVSSNTDKQITGN